MENDIKLESYQIGILAGEIILSKGLPVLDVHYGNGLKTVKVSDEDKEKYTELLDVWFNRRIKKEESNDEWIKYREFSILLKDKYLPNVVNYYLPTITVTSIDDFKIGVRDSLWNSDICEYMIEPDEIGITVCEVTNQTIITLKIDIEDDLKELHSRYGTLT